MISNLASDYFCFGIPKVAQCDALLLLATSGVLNSVSGRIQLFIDRVDIESGHLPMFENIQQVSVQARVSFNKAHSKIRFEAKGSPAQCYEYFVAEFTRLTQQYDDAIYLESHPEPTLEELMEVCSTPSAHQSSSLQSLQQRVDDWIQTIGINYFDELTNLSNLMEEVGEVARLIGREYGQQTFKPGERPACVKTALADELSDVLFIVVCLANQMNIDLTDAFSRNMEKKTQRDRARHQSNSKLISPEGAPGE